MAVLSWGKPKIEYSTSTDGAPGTSWTAFPTPKEGTAQLTTNKGSKTEAKEEGGAVVDTRYSANNYEFKFEIFVKKGETRPISDTDGIVTGDYAVRLTPEDESTEGFVMDAATVSVEEKWSAADGKTLVYTFDARKPATGRMLKPYVKTTTP